MSHNRKILAACASILALTATLGPVTTASAENEPSMYVTIGRGSDASQPRAVTLPLNKAIIVDLPTDARDVLLSNPDIADFVVRTARRVFILGRKVGQTNAFFFDAQGRQIANLEIRVEPDVSPLNAMFKRFAPNGSVKAESVNGALVLTGTVKSATEADRVMQIAEKFSAPAGGAQNGASNARSQIVNLIAVEGNEQVLVKVRVVEMSRTLVKQLGVNFTAQDALNTLLPNDWGLNLATENNFSINGKLLGGITASAAGTGANADDARIEALERVGMLRVLAEPNLTAISGEAAKFLAGGEFPVPVQSKDGEISVQFKPFGVGLAFTPVVLSPGRISMKISTEVSELTSDGAINTGDQVFTDANGQRNVVRGITIPALQVRRADTTVEMPSGGSLMMAGLIQEKTRQAMEGVPGAKDLPVFGQLFRSRDFVNNETELVIIVTPYLVDAASSNKLKTPSDGFVNPSDGAAILSGRLNAVYKGVDASGGKQLQGPAGHVIQ